MTELKPCPFCGGHVDIERTIDGSNWWGVVCRNTKNIGGTCAIQQRPSASEKAAIDRWNTRHIPEGYVTKAHMDERIVQAVAAARKAWAQQATIHEGYALVPIEPTKQMLIAMASNSGEDLEEMEEKYKAAIAVAQEEL